MVSMKRFHHQYYPDEVVAEVGALTAEEQADLEDRGHKISVTRRSYGNMNVVTWDRITGEVAAATDPRGAVESEDARVY
jgi:gamma-glutamyltranspeptidase/glutathione hydrolase